MQFKAKKIIRGHIMLWAEQMIEWFAKRKTLLSATHHSFPGMRGQEMIMSGPF